MTNIEVLSLKDGQWKAVQRGGYFGRYLPNGHLVYVHQGTLFAVGFDLDRLEVRGTPAPLHVRPFPGGAPSGSGKWQISTGGGLRPIWSRNSRELFYQAPNTRIMVATYTAKADSFDADKARFAGS